ncbi:hypothetical protein I7I51_07326 [Histoplasma capsulatum]|uniref:ABM domain-containing protein n=1 Tax=Ajellomyces capsulatus TaxID=5037 RepID=A0A8A1MKT1_AJECA|nr:predicted protein [Histoplasma mississippiense (nom. inval.)]EDN05372.1 predicted protein [Histoplasma mississippiense (nom. inval.)]QSS66469.1 hypothetical protein I7I51_07326 [Histoplasma capsulatum]
MDTDATRQSHPAADEAVASNTEQVSGENGHRSHQYTQSSTEKHAIVISEMWKNENSCYAELKTLLTFYDHLKAEGLLFMMSARHYQEISVVLQSASVDEWAAAFRQWLEMFRTDAIKHVKDTDFITSIFTEFNQKQEQASPNEEAILNMIDEFKELEV